MWDGPGLQQLLVSSVRFINDILSDTMEVYMENISVSTTSAQMKLALAKILHASPFKCSSGPVMNFSVVFLRRKNRTKSGKLTLPTMAIGRQFLDLCGGVNPKEFVVVVGAKVKFTQSRDQARQDIVEEICTRPFLDPKLEEKRQAQSSRRASSPIDIDAVQLGWACRNQSFSIEWEQECRSYGTMSYDEDRREFTVKITGEEDIRMVVIHVASISWASAHVDPQRDPIIILELVHAPAFETAPPLHPDELHEILSNMKLEARTVTPPRGHGGELRQRWSAIDVNHVDIAPYVSQMVRLICSELDDLAHFRSICTQAHLPVEDFAMPTIYGRLFSEPVRRRYRKFLLHLEWSTAFHIEAMTRDHLIDLKEALTLHEPIKQMILKLGVERTSSFLQHFATQMKSRFHTFSDSQGSSETVEQFFHRCASETSAAVPRRILGHSNTENDTFHCLHLTVTPTTFILGGPYSERLNRVIRWYPNNHNCFLRVNFVDESHLSIRFDRDVDGRSFIKRRFGHFLQHGIEVAGRRFEFLAYSQSALKDHAVWFMKKFYDERKNLVTAASIIKRIGNFEKLAYDPKLIYCPARYGARISQSFTATDSSVSAEAEEVFILEDVLDPTGTWAFTDGVGTISPDLACAIVQDLRRRGRRAIRSKIHPRAFQIRFMGSKGMLSVNYKLTGRAICIRPSMIKFDAPNSREIEIAQAFDRPRPFFMNRPLIMILEDLGVSYDSFKDLQDAAVAEVKRSVESLGQAAAFLEKYGLGVSYRLSSVMLSLSKLGLDNLLWDEFWEQMMDFGVNHVLRELKHHARIPVEHAWNLVGVADVHGYLKEGEVFVHIAPINGSPIYLDGLVTVSRSPTCHPGDIQVARAIGQPPPGSPFESESLPNCIVFSIKGNRPLQSGLGGGDLDGDIYCCIALASLRPRTVETPAEYKPAEKVMLTRPSTMRDVADFVTEYISSDTVGIIAHNWLLIADRSKQGVFDEDCLLLSELHSDAVDYPKSGKPVPFEKIPRLRDKQRPDWSAPETAHLDPRRFYESKRAVGKLFRAIDLPVLQTANRGWQLAGDDFVSLEDALEDFYTDDGFDGVTHAIEEHVSQYIRLKSHDEELIAEIWDLAENYRSQLQTICADHSLSRTRNAILTEAEAVMGTIVAKCAQQRRRKDAISNLREQTASLVQDIEYQLAGEHGTLPEISLRRGWIAYRLSLLISHQFGARSFGWIAVREIFDSVRNIEEDRAGLY